MGYAMNQGPKFFCEKIFAADEKTLRVQSGWILFDSYPFMPAKYLMRQDDTVKEAQALFRSASSSCVS